MQGYLRNITSSLSSAAQTFQDRYTTGRQYVFGSITVEEVALVAEGGFGFIFLCRHVVSDQQFVIKKLNCQDKERLALALREVEVYERIGQSEHIVKYYGHVIEQIDFRCKEVNLLFEFLPNGHLLDLLNRHDGNLSEVLIVEILRDVAKGLVHLQKFNIQNRDLKIENILQAADGRWVLVDLGSWSDQAVNPKALSKAELSKAEEEIERFTTMMYRSPEMVDMYKGFPISTQSDIWMLGCVLFTLMHNKHPFQDESKLAIANARFHLDSSVFSRFSHTLIDLLFLLLAENPDNRPTAAELVRILDDWRAVSSSGLALPRPVLERLEKVFKIHGVARTAVSTAPRPQDRRIAAQAPAPAVVDQGWADFGSFKPPMEDFFALPPSVPPAVSRPAPSQQPQPAVEENWADFSAFAPAVAESTPADWTADFDAFESFTAGSAPSAGAPVPKSGAVGEWLGFVGLGLLTLAFAVAIRRLVALAPDADDAGDGHRADGRPQRRRDALRRAREAEQQERDERMVEKELRNLEKEEERICRLQEQLKLVRSEYKQWESKMKCVPVDPIPDDVPVSDSELIDFLKARRIAAIGDVARHFRLSVKTTLQRLTAFNDARLARLYIDQSGLVVLYDNDHVQAVLKHKSDRREAARALHQLFR